LQISPTNTISVGNSSPPWMSPAPGFRAIVGPVDRLKRSLSGRLPVLAKRQLFLEG
jgi:hypothetical protein